MKKILLIMIVFLSVLLYIKYGKIFLEYYINKNKPINKRCKIKDKIKDKIKVDINKTYKVVTSCTTSPLRINKMEHTLESLENQTISPDNMMLNLPYVYSRTNETYTIPEYINNNKKIVVNRLDMDYGPATKLVGAILNIPKDEDTWILVHDDDHLYLENTIENHVEYINKLKSNKIALAISGFKLINDKVDHIKKDLGEIDVLEGFCTFSVHRSVFEDDFLPYILSVIKNIDSKLSDDLIISNYLALKNIKILLISNNKISREIWWKSGCELEYGMQDDALHKLAKGDKEDPLGGHYKKYLRAIKFLRDNNMYYIDKKLKSL
jgi:hypothetical protein